MNNSTLEWAKIIDMKYVAGFSYFRILGFVIHLLLLISLIHFRADMHQMSLASINEVTPPKNVAWVNSLMHAGLGLPFDGYRHRTIPHTKHL